MPIIKLFNATFHYAKLTTYSNIWIFRIFFPLEVKIKTKMLHKT